MVGVALMLIGFFSLCIADGEIGGTTFAYVSLAGGVIISILSGLFCILNGGGL
nr:MAG TPA: hypothetical protein [Caudoviricetes sp.]